MQEDVGEGAPTPPPVEAEPERPAEAGGREEGRGHGDRIGIGGGDDSVSRIQLAARWAEAYAPSQGDTLRASLSRFRQAYDYLDAVLHGIEPPSQDGEEADD